MRLRYLLLALTAAALVPVASGCGGGGEEATAQTTMPLAKYVLKPFADTSMVYGPTGKFGRV